MIYPNFLRYFYSGKFYGKNFLAPLDQLMDKIYRSRLVIRCVFDKIFRTKVNLKSFHNESGQKRFIRRASSRESSHRLSHHYAGNFVICKSIRSVWSDRLMPTKRIERHSLQAKLIPGESVELNLKIWLQRMRSVGCLTNSMEIVKAPALSFRHI